LADWKRIMPTTIFDWIARTAMLAMAGLVTLSILGAIAAMTNDPGIRFAAPRDRPVIEGVREARDEQEPAQAPSRPAERGDSAAEGPAGGEVVAVAPAPPALDDKVARWLEALTYALLALVGVGALAVLVLLNILRELRRTGRSL
jgi:hypothetical protein